MIVIAPALSGGADPHVPKCLDSFEQLAFILLNTITALIVCSLSSAGRWSTQSRAKLHNITADSSTVQRWTPSKSSSLQKRSLYLLRSHKCKTSLAWELKHKDFAETGKREFHCPSCVSMYALILYHRHCSTFAGSLTDSSSSPTTTDPNAGRAVD